WHFHIKLVFGARCIPRQQKKNQKQQQHIDQWRELNARMMQRGATTKVHEARCAVRGAGFGITIRLRSKSRQELAPFAYCIAMKATPERASKLPRVRKLISVPCRERTRKRSSPECRQPAP